MDSFGQHPVETGCGYDPEDGVMHPVLRHSSWSLLLLPGLCGTAWAATDPAATVAAPFSWQQFLGPFHMVLLHLPIGFLTLVALLELWTWRKPSTERRQVIQFGLVLGVIATGLTMILGYLRASDGGYDELTLQSHRGWGIAGGALVAIACALHALLLKHPAPGGLVGFRLILFTGFLCLSVAGHHGGSLTHGTGLLTENAPDLLRSWANNPQEAPPTSSNDPALAAIRTVLDQKCVSCHGAEKQKGGLRLDTRTAALAAGDSTRPALTPGDPGRSEIVRAILLPRDHDEAMPPEGKETLTPTEIEAIIHWIQTGAPE